MRKHIHILYVCMHICLYVCVHIHKSKLESKQNELTQTQTSAYCMITPYTQNTKMGKITHAAREQLECGGGVGWKETRRDWEELALDLGTVSWALVKSNQLYTTHFSMWILYFNNKMFWCPTIDEWIHKTWYVHNAIFFSRKREGKSGTWDNTAEPRWHYAKRNKPSMLTALF